MKNIRSYILGAAAFATLAFVAPACQDDIDAPGVDVPHATMEANISILDLKTQFWNDATNYATQIKDPNDPERRFIVAGRVCSSDESGNLNQTLILQDETAALQLSISSYNLYLNYRVGQEIVMDLTDMYIGKYNGMQQVGRPEPYQDTYEITRMSPEFFAEHIELNGLPEVDKVDTLQISTFGQLAQTTENLIKYQGQLVCLQNVHWQDAGQIRFSAYHENTNTTLLDRNEAQMTVRTSGYSNFWNQLLPTGNLDVVGVLGYFGNSGWQLTLIDGNSWKAAGDRPGTKDKPYTVAQVIENETDGGSGEGWVKGYIVGAVAPEVESISSDNDIEWTAPTVLNNTLVIAPTADTKDITKCLVFALPANSALRQYGNLHDNAANLGKEILITGSFEKYMGTFGLGNISGKADDFSIEGVTIDNGEFADGDGQESTPYNVGQIVAMNPTSTQEAVQSGVWVKGYIVGSMPTGGSSTTLSGTNFSTQDAAATNLVLGPTPDCTDPSKCIGIQLSTSIRGALALANKPENLGKVLMIKGDVMKYCGGPGLKNGAEYKLDGAGDTPTPPEPGGESVTTISEDFASGSIPSTWSNVQVSGSKAWYVTEFSGVHYAAMTGYKGNGAPYESWLITPAIDMSKVSKKALTFRTQVNGYGSTSTDFGVYVLTSNAPANGNPVKLNATLATAPASGYSGWTESGDIDLTAYSGTIYIGFKYSATDETTATWCVTDIKLNTTTGGGDDPNPNPNPGGDPADPSGDVVNIAADNFKGENDSAGKPTLLTTATVDGYTVTIDKSSGATAPAYNEYNGAGTIRLYADNTLTVAGARMAKIEFTLNTSTGAKRYTTFTPNTGSVTEQKADDTQITWSGDATSVTFTVGHDATIGSDGASKRGQVHITDIKVYPAK